MGNAGDQATLVIGGTGKTGRRVAERLKARGVSVRVGSRTGQPAFRWEDRATWADVLSGVQQAYVAYSPDLAVPGAVEAVSAFSELAVRKGIRRLVLLSGRGEDEAERAEEVIRRAGVEWTIVRASWFSQNFSESFLVDPVRAGSVELPAGDVREPFVDVDDVADVAVAALTEHRHAGQLYELTGPRLLSFAEAVAEIGAATGRRISYARISLDDYASALRGLDVPADYIWLVTYLFGTVLDGRNARLADGVERALGRGPKDFADYARQAAAAGVWES